MRIAGTIQDSIVDGPGLRYVVFVQGCTLCCEGCHNPETWAIDGGTEVSVEEIIAELQSNPLTDGITISGGEPFLQAEECKELARAARERGFNVWAYTGKTFEEVYCERGTAAYELLRMLDVLVDGAYKKDERSMSIRWRGSRNQRVIDVKRSIAKGEAVILEVER